MRNIMYNLAALALIALLLSGCRSTNIGAYHNYEIECLGVELDGSQTLYSWGTGRNKTDAIEQAKKNAVYAVLFKGIQKGSNRGCALKPLLLEVNAHEKYEYYFNAFLKDGGDYMQYVSMEDAKANSQKVERSKEQVKYGIVVRVLRSELKERLINDQIIKP